ncbi:Scr1 family TA system antitoxin-like transcriptional regulator [Streptomyces sp. AK010]|uniref:DUF5753 domain-containing protein n=1 Tax=Streptomyces sp. AK010 TaxID=2723074 RepID=UPI001610A009|nr:hypothetical protein [Streptomyces sp. AK010]
MSARSKGISSVIAFAMTGALASLVGQIETAHKAPTREFAERADAALMADGCFSRLVGLVLRSQLPAWFQAYAEMEAKATYICTYQSQVVYGLLQTQEYARAVLGASQPENLEELVAARMERQRLLRRNKPPLVWAMLDEAVLYRPVGGREVMRNQLAHLLSLRNQRRLKIQVLPLSAGNTRACRVLSTSCASTPTRTSSTPRTSSRGT